jgi:hypothetical protein
MTQKLDRSRSSGPEAPSAKVKCLRLAFKRPSAPPLEGSAQRCCRRETLAASLSLHDPNSGLVEAAAQRRVPLTVLEVDAPDARNLYARKLVFVRPDQHVAWRGDEQPAVPMDLIDLVRGGRRASACKTA